MLAAIHSLISQFDNNNNDKINSQDVFFLMSIESLAHMHALSHECSRNRRQGVGRMHNYAGQCILMMWRGRSRFCQTAWEHTVTCMNALECVKV